MTIPEKLSTFSASRTRLRPRMLMERPAASASAMPTEVMPSPPIWISSASTTCPNRVRVSAASTTTSPVTQTALVAVNSESSGVKVCPGLTEQGSNSSPAPSRMTSANPAAIMRPGGCR